MTGGRGKSFIGFSRKGLLFLKNLKTNNDKVWFEAHNHEYEKRLLDPMRHLVADLGEFMLTIDPLFEIRPAVNKTISRIYRDTRFSRDKSPYRTTMWLTFKRPGKGWQDAPHTFLRLRRLHTDTAWDSTPCRKIRWINFERLLTQSRRSFRK